MYKPDEVNLPSVLDGDNYANPSLKRFQEYTQQKLELMTDGDCFVVRCVLVDYIYRNLDEAQTDSQKSKDEEEQENANQPRRIFEQRNQAWYHYVTLGLEFDKSTIEPQSSTGQIGVNDLSKLIQRLYIERYADSTAMIHPYVEDIDSSTPNTSSCAQFSSWVGCVTHSTMRQMELATPNPFFRVV